MEDQSHPDRLSAQAKPHVSIVGGGLAGMVAARELLKRGHAVTIFEATARLGGKAGAECHGPDFDEHGWHLFPLWYLNIWALVAELGIRDSFVDQNRYAYMREGQYPARVWLDCPFSFRSTLHNIFHGVLPPAISFLYQFALLDLMSQPVRRRAQLDQVTVNGFVRGKFYGIDGVAEGLEDTISRASAIESFEMSAMTVRNVMQFWFKYHDPWFRVLNGNLQQKWIDPIEKSLRELGCVIELESRVTAISCEAGRVVALEGTRGSAAAAWTQPVDNLVLAVPAPNLKNLLTPELLACAPSLGTVYYLRSRIMAGMTLYFKRRIAGIPQDHLNFVDTPYELSIIDVTELWGIHDKTVICVVASDYTTLQGYSSEAAIPILIAELKRYLPFVSMDDIERVDLQSHVDQPLFANTAGAWPRRPKGPTEISNLFVAGDFCQSHVDLTCMEGAVTSGLQAAEAVRVKTSLGEAVPILVPQTLPRWLMVLLKWLLTPGALIALLWASIFGRQES